ncbi:MAG: TetR/AcrR family transcriptional regulator [Candidatus Nanopelagicales bacterium]
MQLVPLDRPEAVEAAQVRRAPAPKAVERKRMTGLERREQLILVGRRLFAELGYESVTVEAIAQAAKVSKPVVYEHFAGVEIDGKEFGTKEALYAVIVDREIAELLHAIQSGLEASHPRLMIEQSVMALLTYIERNDEGFQILVRDSPVGMAGNFSNLMADIAVRVQHLLAREFKARGLNPKLAPLYAQSLVGMIALTGQWWLDARRPGKQEVASHIVNLAWHGLQGLEKDPKLIGKFD